MSDFPLAREEFRHFLETFPGFDTSLEPAEKLRPMLASWPKPPMPDASVVRMDSVNIKDKDGGSLRVLVARPAAAAQEEAAKAPLLFVIHGGGGIIGAPEMDMPLIGELVQAGYAVVSPDYRLAPEHPHPAAHDDVDRAYHWATSRDGADQYRFDVTKIGLFGSSQGSMLAASLARRLRGASNAPYVTILDSLLADDRLIYPSQQADCQTAQYHIWTKANAIAATKWLYGSEQPNLTVEESPLRSTTSTDFAGLGQHYITSCELDLLAEHGPEYTARLEQARVSVEHKRWEGAIHAFATLTATPLAVEAPKQYISWFDKHLR